jgi:hypothetical protein
MLSGISSGSTKSERIIITKKRDNYGIVFAVGLFYGDHKSTLFEPYLQHIKATRGNPDKKNVENFQRGLEKVINLQEEVRFASEFPPIVELCASDSAIAAVTGIVFSYPSFKMNIVADGNISIQASKTLHNSVTNQKQPAKESLYSVRADKFLQPGDKFVNVRAGPLHMIALTRMNFI